MDKCILASNIHPNVIAGLIPVSTLAFFGIDGDTHNCIRSQFTYVDNNYFDNPFNPDNLPFMGVAAAEAKKLGWKYLLGIFEAPSKNTYFIRGC